MIVEKPADIAEGGPLIFHGFAVPVIVRIKE
jgi:hypothetical protein